MDAFLSRCSRMAIESARTYPNLVDDLSHVVALRYFANEIYFEAADAVMNGLWSVCVSEEFWAYRDRTVPPVTSAIYLEFDAAIFLKK